MRRLLKPAQQLIETKYFTSLVSASVYDPGEPKRQNTFLEALQTLPGLRIYYGHFLQSTYTCRNCGATRLMQSEKMTDVNIATELLIDAFQDRFDTALLISADSDLIGPIVQVKALFPAKRVIVGFPPDRHSIALATRAAASFQIGRAKIAASQLPDRVIKPDGFVLHRPAKWT